MILSRYRNEPLSDEQINEAAPSAFATQPWVETSERYVFIPTSDIIAGMRNAGFLPYFATQSTSRIPGKKFFTKHMVRFRPVNPTEAITKVGDTFVESILINSHDRTSLFDMGLGAFRLTCLNGASVSEGLAENIRIRHTGDILSAVIDATTKLIAQAPKVVNAINTWKTINLRPEEALVLAEQAHSLRFDDSPVGAQISADRLLVPRRREDNGTDLWSTFNRIQENAIRGGLKTFRAGGRDENDRYVAPRRGRTQPVAGISQNQALNKALWSLAEKMAELKTA